MVRIITDSVAGIPSAVSIILVKYEQEGNALPKEKVEKIQKEFDELPVAAHKPFFLDFAIEKGLFKKEDQAYVLNIRPRYTLEFCKKVLDELVLNPEPFTVPEGTFNHLVPHWGNNGLVNEAHTETEAKNIIGAACAATANSFKLNVQIINSNPEIIKDKNNLDHIMNTYSDTKKALDFLLSEPSLIKINYKPIAKLPKKGISIIESISNGLKFISQFYPEFSKNLDEYIRNRIEIELRMGLEAKIKLMHSL